MSQNSTEGGPIQLWDVETKTLNTTLNTTHSRVSSLAFNNSGDALAVTFDVPTGLIAFESGGAMGIYSVKSGNEVTSFPSLPAALTSVRWNSTDQRIVSSSRDGFIRIWRIDGTELLSSSPFDSTPVKKAFWDRSGGRLIASAYLNTRLTSWSIEDGLDGVSIHNSPVLLGKLLDNPTIDRNTIANMYSSSGQFEEAETLYREISEEDENEAVFSTNYWRLKTLPTVLADLNLSHIHI